MKQAKLAKDGEVTRERSYRGHQNQHWTTTARLRQTANTEQNAEETVSGAVMKAFLLAPAQEFLP